jgi:hypothetical protein
LEAVIRNAYLADDLLHVADSGVEGGMSFFELAFIDALEGLGGHLADHDLISFILVYLVQIADYD